MAQRGDVIIVSVPYLSGAMAKNRPAVVVQADAANRLLAHTTIAAVSSNVRGAVNPWQLLVDPTTNDGKQTGLHHLSVVRCDRLFTIEQSSIVRVIGRMPAALIRKLDDCLRTALEIQ